MDWKGKKVLVTGAAGFIGSHLTERLVGDGADVTVFIRYNSRADDGLLKLLPNEVRKSIRVIFGDLRDSDAVQRAVNGQQVVFHLAALIGIPYSYVHPLDYVQTNVVGTTNVLLACRNAGVDRLVHTSTSETYGTALYVPIDEKHPLQGQSPYSASKIGADQLALSFHLSFDLPVAVIRPFNTFGPRQSSRAIIPTIISQALRRDGVRLGSLTPTRDLTFVQDTVEGFLKVGDHPAAIGPVINVGSGAEITMGKLAEKIFTLLGQQPMVEADPTRIRPDNSEVLRLLADNRKAKELIGWSPKVSLDEGLRRTIEWVRENLSLFQASGYHV
jgi:NAD dependent epimerase/dehydratase